MPIGVESTNLLKGLQTRNNSTSIFVQEIADNNMISNRWTRGRIILKRRQTVGVRGLIDMEWRLFIEAMSSCGVILFPSNTIISCYIVSMTTFQAWAYYPFQIIFSSNALLPQFFYFYTNILTHNREWNTGGLWQGSPPHEGRPRTSKERFHGCRDGRPDLTQVTGNQGYRTSWPQVLLGQDGSNRVPWLIIRLLASFWIDNCVHNTLKFDLYVLRVLSLTSNPPFFSLYVSSQRSIRLHHQRHSYYIRCDISISLLYVFPHETSLKWNIRTAYRRAYMLFSSTYHKSIDFVLVLQFITHTITGRQWSSRIEGSFAIAILDFRWPSVLALFSLPCLTQPPCLSRSVPIV